MRYVYITLDIRSWLTCTVTCRGPYGVSTSTVSTLSASEPISCRIIEGDGLSSSSEELSVLLILFFTCSVECKLVLQVFRQGGHIQTVV